MKMKSEGGIHNRDNTAGFVNIEDGEGAEMRINPEYLKTALKVIDSLSGLVLATSDIHIGITPQTGENTTGLFCVFLDPNKTVAYAIAGK